MKQNIIEVTPLAFMYERTLNYYFITLDEAQNTMSWLYTHMLKILNNVADISFTIFVAKDIVKHPLVQKIVEAYEVYR